MSLRFVSTPYYRHFLQVQTAKIAPARGMARSPYSDPRGFTFTDMKKNPAVLPLVIIIGVAVTGVCGFSTYSFLTRPDVSLNRKNYTWDTMDVMNPQKMKVITFNQVPKPMPELHDALSYREEYNQQQKASE